MKVLGVVKLNKFKEYRKKKGLTLDQIAKKMSFSRSQISLVENGKSKPSKRFIDDFVDTLQLNENEKNEIYSYTGVLSEISENSEEFKSLSDMGTIEVKTDGKYRVLQNPYYNLKWLLNQRSSNVVYAYKDIAIGYDDHGFEIDVEVMNSIVLDNDSLEMIDNYIKSTVIPHQDFKNIKPKYEELSKEISQLIEDSEINDNDKELLKKRLKFIALKNQEFDE